MPRFIESSKITSELELLVTEAAGDLLLVSPVIHLTESVFIKLAEASVRGVTITILCGTVPDPAATRLLSVIKNLRLICVENINARCYFNENSVLITSLGLDDMINSSSVNTGILFKADTDIDLYKEIRRWIEELTANGIRLILEPGSDSHRIISDVTYRGFCIGCGMPVTYNKSRPFCNMCRKIFESGADDIPGSFCHSCGKEHAVTLTENICITCNAS